MSFFDADYAAIEARIVCWLAGQTDALDEFRNNVDRYKKMASLIYNVPIEQVNKHPQRFVGKSAILGCGFGMGPPKFRGTCENFGCILPDGLEEVAVAAFRKTHHAVVRYWYAVEEAAKRAITNRGEVCKPIPKLRRGESPGTRLPVFQDVRFVVKDLEGTPFLLIRLPSGRKLAYPRPRLVNSTKFEGATAIQFFGHIKGTMWGWVDTYGGKLVENITQAVAADVMANGVHNTERRGYETATLIHDQCLSFYHPERGQTVEEFVELLTTLPSWASGLPIAAEGSVVPYYRKD